MSFQGAFTLFGLGVVLLGVLSSMLPSERSRPRRVTVPLVLAGLVIFGFGVILQFVLGTVALSQF